MFKLLSRAWRYLTAALTGKFNEVADPKVQLEQAITEAQDQHRRLIEQAANVVANQKQTEMRLSRRCWSWASVIACSSCTLGSAISLNRPVSKAVRYFHALLKSLSMPRG